MVGRFLTLAFVTAFLAQESLQEEPYSYWNSAQSNQLADSYWHGATGNQSPANKLLRRQDLGFASILPALLFSTAGAAASVSFTALRADDLSRRIDKEKDNIAAQKNSLNSANERINTVNTRLAMAEANVKNTCNALSNLLKVAKPEYITNPATIPPTPSPNPVSGNLGSSTGQWPIFNAIVAPGASPAALPVGTFPLNGATIRAWKPLDSTNSDSAAVSLVDFNNFRLSVVNVIDILDFKMREILSVSRPTCP